MIRGAIVFGWAGIAALVVSTVHATDNPHTGFLLLLAFLLGALNGYLMRIEEEGDGGDNDQRTERRDAAD